MLLVSLTLASCGGDDGGGGPRPLIFGGDRPAELSAPASPTPGKLYPLIVVLHGYGVNGFTQTAYFGLGGVADRDEALLIAPDGTLDSSGKQFWNADPACCDFGNKNPDDVAYIGGLIDDISATWPVDPEAVYLVGHSNGGFMSYRMACERADVIAAIAPLAGMASSTPAACQPSRAVNVLHLHGTADAAVPYQSGGSGIGALGAEGSVLQWAGHNGCGTTLTAGERLDLESSQAGTETQTHTVTGCPPDGAVELWEIQGASHIPVWTPTFTPTLLAWLTAHRRS